jgi:chorismate dehydratase
LIPAEPIKNRPRVCAVSYLNTVPLMWGLLRDPALQDIFDLGFALPSICADQLAAGEADIGIVPAIEMARQKLGYFRGSGISSYGPVRSILLISKVPFREVRKLATDSGSRTSVMLSRIILAEKFGAQPSLISRPPDLASMLGIADAALLIGDAALQVDPATLPFETLDLGEEWTRLTGLPMVFAVWAGQPAKLKDSYGDALLASCRYGLGHMEEIVHEEAAKRGFPESLVREYLTRHIIFEFGEAHYAGLETYLKRAAELDRTVVPGSVTV